MSMQKPAGTIILLSLTIQATAFAQLKPDRPAGGAAPVRAESGTKCPPPAPPLSIERTANKGESGQREEFTPTRHLWGDADRDGLQDLFVLDRKGNLLFKKRGDGGFVDTAAMG